MMEKGGKVNDSLTEAAFSAILSGNSISELRATNSHGGSMRFFLLILARTLRRARVPFLIICTISFALFASTAWWMHSTYPQLAAQARAEEVAFWHMANDLTLDDRSALLNHSLRTGQLPRVLPWWEHDRHMCSAVVVKYINLFTNIKFVHSSAWTLREKRACPGPKCVSNARKLTTVWDATEEFAPDGSLTQDQLKELTQEVRELEYDPDKVYVMGLLWANTSYWEKITADNADINSHVALIVRGRVIHFIDMGDGVDPLRLETLEEVFTRGDLKPVWVAEVHKKTQDGGRKRGLVKTDLHLPVTKRELAFEQRVWPWKSLRRFLVFPSRPWYTPNHWHGFFQQADTLVEKSLLHRYRNGYDPYPTKFVEQETTP